MRIKRNSIIAILMIALFIIPSLKCSFLVSSTPTLLQGAVAMAVKGEATIVTKNGTRIKLTKNLKFSASGIVLPGAQLITGPNSSIDLVFTDSIKVRIGANSSLTLDVARLLESRQFTQIKMRLKKGKIFATTGGKLSKHSSFILSTLQSVVNVRGTEFYVEETGSSNNVMVSKGGVDVTDGDGAKSVYVEEGKSAGIAPSGHAELSDINAEQKNILETMSNDIASLTADEKKKIKEIAETHEENVRLIKEAYEIQKALITGAVINQKELDAQNVKAQMERDSAEVGKVKSSASDEVQKIKNASKK